MSKPTPLPLTTALWDDCDDEFDGQEISPHLQALVHECQPHRRYPMPKRAQKSEHFRQTVYRNREIRAWHGDPECPHGHQPGHA